MDPNNPDDQDPYAWKKQNWSVAFNPDLTLPEDLGPAGLDPGDLTDDQVYLNAILRMADSRSTCSPILSPKQVDPENKFERDHFFEVQDFVKIIYAGWPNYEWRKIEQGYFIDLATFISNERNLFVVSKAWNREKSRIGLQNYHENDQIQDYLTWKVTEDMTVEESLRSLVNQMATWKNSQWPHLTAFCGIALKRYMGWT